MNTNSNSAPSFDFSGEIVIQYDQRLGPMFFEPYAVEISKRIENLPVSLAMELASGTGRVTRHLREKLPSSAKLLASDISEDMLEVAKDKLGDLDIDWQIIDAQQLPFQEGSFDLLVCCFGYMFVPDKPKAFAEAYRVLKPGGLLLFSTWDKLENNAASFVYRRTAKKYLGDPVPESYNLPFSMNEENAIKALLHDAGFSKIVIEKVKLDSVSPTAKEAADGLATGGLIYKEIMKRNPAWMDEIKSTVEQELSEKYGVAPMIAPMSAVISQAWK